MLKKCHQLTGLQRATLFSSLNAAASELGEDPADYRKRIQREVLGVEHLSDVSSTDGFDRLMQRIWTDRGDYSRALDYAGGDVKRFRHLALKAAAEICGCGVLDIPAYRYIAGVMVQMNMATYERDVLALRLMRDSGWDDFTDIKLKSLVSALNVHVRRKR